MLENIREKFHLNGPFLSWFWSLKLAIAAEIIIVIFGLLAGRGSQVI
jgi:hypothetical protein